MNKEKGTGKKYRVSLVESSPLRTVDPRTKLALSLCASLAVMLPLEKIVVAICIYIVLLLWARLLHIAARQAWQLKWILIVLFLVDWWVVGIDLAATITLRLVLLSGAFTLFFATTIPSELCLALEWARLPYRYAFSVSLAFQSISLLEEEWRSIREAQQSRGALKIPTGWRQLVEDTNDLVSLAVPAIVLTTKRAWAMTEAAYARGFDSPHRQPYHQLMMRTLDWVLLIGALSGSIGLLLWK